VRGGLNGFATILGARGEDGVRVFALPITVIGQRHTVVVARSLEEQSDRLESAASGRSNGPRGRLCRPVYRLR